MRFFLCLLLFLVKILCASNICIFVDHQCTLSARNYSIFYELEKTMQTHADHIFVTPALWAFFCKYQTINQRKKLHPKWQFYDTRIGLIYIKPKKMSKKNGINTTKFKRLKHPFKKKIDDDFWISLFPTLFNIKKWQQYHQDSTDPVIVYMDGHGSKRKNDPSAELACGIPAYEFARLLHFFNTSLHIDLLGVQTCHWTSMRILELMANQYKHTTAPFGIITPLRTEKILITAPRYSDSKNPRDFCFFDAIQHIMPCYRGTITPKMRAIACAIDTLKIPANSKQGITFTPAGDILTHVL